MAIDKVKLFENAKVLWPPEINFGGMVFEGKKVSGKQIQNELYYLIEASIDVNNHWMQLSIWAFHQALWDCSQKRLENGQLLVRPEEVEFEDFDRKMRNNLLGDDCWLEERKAYL